MLPLNIGAIFHIWRIDNYHTVSDCKTKHLNLQSLEIKRSIGVMYVPYSKIQLPRKQQRAHFILDKTATDDTILAR